MGVYWSADQRDQYNDPFKGKSTNLERPEIFIVKCLQVDLQRNFAVRLKDHQDLKRCLLTEIPLLLVLDITSFGSD